MRNSFKQLYSIELAADLYSAAVKRFARMNHIEILQGDSATVLPSLLSRIKEPSLFWLDGHYSGGITAKGALETPILQELEHIFNHPIKDHVILIDDARDFIGENDYPAISALREFVFKRRPDLMFEVKHDIIRIIK